MKVRKDTRYMNLLKLSLFSEVCLSQIITVFMILLFKKMSESVRSTNVLFHQTDCTKQETMTELNRF